FLSACSWLNYQPIGERIAGTRFIAFKVPLRQTINETVDEGLRLAPQSLLESVPNLGLIVDLTNTNRYYSPQTFRKENVEHQKLMIPGHHTPSKALAQKFCQYVTNFLDANADNDKLIGVHCTHGVNRTGYLICYFMITRMNMSPKQAIKTFADARGHKIERENYTSSLLQLLQESEEAPGSRRTSVHEFDGAEPRQGETKRRNKFDKAEGWQHQQQQQVQPQQMEERRERNWRDRNVEQYSAQRRSNYVAPRSYGQDESSAPMWRKFTDDEYRHRAQEDTGRWARQRWRYGQTEDRGYKRNHLQADSYNNYNSINNNYNNNNYNNNAYMYNRASRGDGYSKNNSRNNYGGNFRNNGNNLSNNGDNFRDNVFNGYNRD
ncbi:hypothetical protein KR222_011460, partial [Zaprionus bogoriensis]